VIKDFLDQVIRNAKELNRKIDQFYLSATDWKALHASFAPLTEGTDNDIPAGAVGRYCGIPIFIHPKEAKLNEPDNT